MADIPQAIGRYHVLKPLGQGGMGTLYLARDPGIDRLVAVKLMRDGFESDEMRERFSREARAIGRLRHPNIVTIYEFGEHGGRPFIAMEFVRGETLAQLIRRQAPLPLIQKVHVIEQLCSGLGHAHAQGIVHRDIKPANLILDENESLRILDFGIVRFGETGLTQSGQMIGTLNYMAPEQLRGKPVDHRADAFAVGAVFYELLTYRRAFPGDLQSGLLTRILDGQAEPLSTLIPSLDPDVRSLVEALLSTRPDDRPDLRDVARRLALMKGRLERESPLAYETTVLAPPPKAPRKRRAPRRAPIREVVAERAGAELHPRTPGATGTPKSRAASILTPSSGGHEAAAPGSPEAEGVVPAERIIDEARRQIALGWYDSALALLRNASGHPAIDAAIKGLEGQLKRPAYDKPPPRAQDERALSLSAQQRPDDELLPAQFYEPVSRLWPVIGTLPIVFAFLFMLSRC